MDGRTYEGEAYAVLTDAGELIFFRSEEEYEDGKITLARDVFGNEYEGRVFAGVETKQWAYDNLPEWTDERHNRPIVSVRIADGQAIAPVSCALWFYWQDVMSVCNLEGLDTSAVTDMNHMFYRCESLVEPPDTSGWDTSRVEDMGCMFMSCHNLQTPPDTSKWDTSRVTDIDFMFADCHSLVEPPDTSKWDTSRITSMQCVFRYCRSLASPPDTSKWDTSNVTSMREMFFFCHSLQTSPDTIKWDTSRVEDMSYMFASCNSLKTPPDTSGWDTSRVVDMSHMFAWCNSLKEPPDTSGWDTSSLREYEHMFDGCASLANVPEVQTVVRIKSKRDNVALDAGILADTQYLRDVLNNDPSRIDPAGNLNEAEFEEKVERIAKEAVRGNEFRNRLRQAIAEDSHLWGRLQDIVDQELYHFVDERVRTPVDPTR